MSKTTLIIARHGNTFEPGQTPTRVGARTDLKLTGAGREQAAAIGHYLKANGLVPDVAYSSQLRRTIETAEIAVQESGYKQPVYPLEIFNEIDYGPDENKPEPEVIARLGPEALQAWDEHAIVPPGWAVEPETIIKNWQGFGAQISQHNDNETVLVVTSNGIARFAPYLTGDFEGFRARHKIKISTGALCLLTHENGIWQIEDWNIKPWELQD